MAGDGAILFDLDGTLVLTDALEALRRERRWADVYASLDRTSVPPGTAEFTAWARGLAPCGVVTTAPRPYAERLLAHHGLELSVLVAYHDARPHKPHPAPLLRAAALIGVDPVRCVHVGDLPIDDAAARSAGMASILVSWGRAGPAAPPGWAEVRAAIAAALARAESGPMLAFNGSTS